ncbi:MAG: Zn-ribbon domain-containing OB-fold protein [Candidatus Aenigmarchaeota archaeon]|nr:Zn-ribbon domain-containing OB-fold protein [Candidatus Aenigmarchaeota archaeon]
MPHRGSVPMSWRLAKHRYAMVGVKCRKCGAAHFPPRMVCMDCGSQDMDKFQFSGNGEILSYTVIHTAPEGFEKQTPYAIALVKLEEGPVVSGHVINKESIEIGKQVSMVFRKLYEDGKAGVINYGFKFEVVE